MSDPMNYQQILLLSASELERYVDKELRHKRGAKPYDYLMHWLSVARQFAYATHDDSWGEFEKEFAIIIKRLVTAERDLERFKTVMRKCDPTCEDRFQMFTHKAQPCPLWMTDKVKP